MSVESVESSTENLYEGMFLLDSAGFAANPDETAQAVLDILQKADATVITSRPWQDGRLAYPVKGHRKGLHYLTYFRMPARGVTQITRACKLNDLIIRHMVIKHPAKLFEAMVTALGGGDAAVDEALKKAKVVSQSELDPVELSSDVESSSDNKSSDNKSSDNKSSE